MHIDVQHSSGITQWQLSAPGGPWRLQPESPKGWQAAVESKLINCGAQRSPLSLDCWAFPDVVIQPAIELGR
jgi:hypothetical protein